MRIFGKIGGTLSQARATYGFLVPFDLALSSATSRPVDHGGFVLDVSAGSFFNYSNVMIGFPDYVFPAPAEQFNKLVDDSAVIAVAGDDSGITASAGGVDEVCEC